jgi:type VI secretion system protein ImpG
MKIQEYYTQELQALRILGAEFSENNPGLSSFLARKGQDPDVERLLEGFSFLTGRLRQYMDEELPEVSHSLAQLLWPNYLRTIPSYSILKYDSSTLMESHVVPKNEEVMAIHAESGEQCIFKTSYETEVLPLDICEASYYTHGEKGVIELFFKTNEGITLDKILSKKLRFYVGNHEHFSDNLFFHLMHHVDDMQLQIEGEEKSHTLSKKLLKSVGFSADEHILPTEKNVFQGYALLQEYFCYRDKFHFIDFIGLDTLQKFPKQSLENAREFSIKITLLEKLKITKNISKDNFQLYCTPIVNLFEADAEPIRKGLQEEYEVRPSGISYQHSEVYSLDKTQGWDSRINKYHKYVSFESFDHSNKDTEYYYTRVKLSEDESRTKTYIRFNPTNSIKNIYEEDVTVSLEILATNRNLPSELKIGDISMTTPKSSVSKIKFKNITVPSKSYIPPIRGDFMWKIISNMSLNYLALDNIQTLRSVLETYDFIGVTDALQKKKTESILSGLESISYETTDMIYKGLPMRGVLSKLKIDSTKFATIGEAYILVNVLDEFFSLYCMINSFHKLEVLIDEKVYFSWAPRMGKQAML